jgi:phosphosulfolactate synthase
VLKGGRNMTFLQLPERTSGERSYGLTSVIDFGISNGELEHILTDYHSMVDFAKVGIGTACVTPHFEKKVNLYKQFGVKPYCGGTLFEKSYHQNKLEAYVSFLKRMGIEWIEVSNGTLDISLRKRIDLVQYLKKDFNIFGEVGSKDPTNEMSVQEWRSEMLALFEAGCSYVITEGRNSGSSGIYTKNGELKKNLIKEVVEGIDVRKVIFEAAKPTHQMYFINEFGANVNLGNVEIQDLIILEAQRRGLRSETFFTFDQIEDYLEEFTI